MAKNAVVSEELANKFKTEKETPYTRWVKAEGLDIIPSHLCAEPAHRRTEALGAARRQRACSSTTTPRAPRTTAM